MPLFARTLALNVFYNFVRDAFHKTEPDWELASLCNILKPLMGWNFAKTAATCRERCGGMGFLSNARFAEYLAVAHTALTAEGDNRVLLHKVVKDMTFAVQRKGYKIPAPRLNIKTQVGTMDDLSQMELLSDLMRFRQVRLCEQLLAKEAQLAKEGVSGYDVNMLRTSNLIQDLAQAYGERRTIDCCIDWLATLTSAADKKAMETVFRVFAIECVVRDIAFYVTEGAAKPQAGANLIIARNSLIKDMSANTADLLVLLNVPEGVLHTPLASDYVKYFSQPNFGEVVAARL